MSRDISGALESAIEQPVLCPFMAVFIDLPDPVRVFTGVGTMTFEGEEWIGAGGFGSIDTLGESADGSATGVKVTLFQVPIELSADVSEQATKGAAFEVWVGAVDETYKTIVAVHRQWRGVTDTYTIIDGGDTLTVEITGESRMRDQRRPAVKRFTDEWHQRHHSGDLFFQYVSQMSELQVLWAKADQSGGASVGSGSVGAGLNGQSNLNTHLF